MIRQKKLLLINLLKEYKVQKQLINQRLDWTVLKSIKMYVDNKTGNFLNINDPINDLQSYNSPRWNKYYNLLSPNEKNIVKKLKNQYKWKIQD